MNKLDLVKEFRRAFSLPIGDVPCVPSPEQLKLHAKLISDEADEILDAIGKPGTVLSGIVNKIKVRDVTGDLLYFTLGLYSEAGLTWDEDEENDCTSTACGYSLANRINAGNHPLEYVRDRIKGLCESLEKHSETVSVEGILTIARELAIRSMQLGFAINAIDHLDSDFEKIHVKNMAKLWTTAQVAEKFGPIGVFNRNQITDEGTWLVEASDHNQWVVRLNGKVQKPPGWVPAQLEGGGV